MWLLTLRDLAFRRSRNALMSLSTGLVLTMILVLTGISGGFGAAAAQTVVAVNPGPWLLLEGVSGPFTAASAFPVTELDGLDADLSATPAAITRSVAQDQNAVSQDVVLIGLPMDTVVLGIPVSDLLIVSDEAGFERGSEITVAGRLANVGDSVSDLTLFAGTPIVIAPLPFVQAAVFEGAEVATAAFLDQRPFPAPRGFTVMTSGAVVADSLRPVEDAENSIRLARFLLWVLAATLIGTLIYVSARDRRHDFAVLKALGAARRGMVAGVFLQAMTVAATAFVTAIVAEAVLRGAFPLTVEVTVSDYLTTLVVTVLIAASASLMGLQQAVSASPIEALDDR